MAGPEISLAAVVNTNKDGAGSPDTEPQSPLVIKIELPVIEDLGIKLHGKLPPVISEMVANSWDADAKRVEITLP